MSSEIVDTFSERYNGFKIVFKIHFKHESPNSDNSSMGLKAHVKVYDTIFFGFVKWPNRDGTSLFYTKAAEWVESDDELAEQIEQLRDEAQTFADSITEARSIGNNRGGARAVYK